MSTQARAREPDASIVAARDEVKYLVDRALARALVKVVREHLPEHHFAGSGANPLPGAQHWVTTVYFDSGRRELFEAARAQENSLKVRAKEYYDEHPGLAQMARSRSELTRHAPLLWIEIKLSRPGHSNKRRVGIPKTEIPQVFEHGHISEHIVEIQRQHYGDDADEILAELESLTRRFDTPLRATALVNYRRLAWQDPGGSLRVTIDQKLAFFAPSASLWTDTEQLHRSRLGAVAGAQAECVLEIKSRGAPPRWLSDLLRQHGLEPVQFSKFVAACEAVAAH